MKKYFFISLVFVVAITISIPVYAQSAKDALMGLKKLQTRCEAGISYRDYSNAVADAKFPVKLFLESSDANKSPELIESIIKVMKHYEFAGMVWQNAFSNSALRGSLTKPMENVIIKQYPRADKDIKEGGAHSKDYGLDFLLKEAVFAIIWDEASKELDNSTKLFAKTEETTSSELANFKHEIEDLKAQIANLKKENEALKKKLKKR